MSRPSLERGEDVHVVEPVHRLLNTSGTRGILQGEDAGAASGQLRACVRLDAFVTVVRPPSPAATAWQPSPSGRRLVRVAGLEPARLSALPPQSSVSANSTIRAAKSHGMERLLNQAECRAASPFSCIYL